MGEKPQIAIALYKSNKDTLAMRRRKEEEKEKEEGGYALGETNNPGCCRGRGEEVCRVEACPDY